VGGRRKKILARHLQNEDVDLTIKSEAGSEQVATEISFVSLPKMIAGASCHRATRRARDHPYLARQLSDGEIWTAHGGVNPCGLVVRRGDRELRTRWLCWRSTRKLRRDTRDKTILYWFGPPESKTLRPVLRFVLLRFQVGLHGRGVDGLLVVPGRTPLPALYWATDKVGGLESRSVTTWKPIFSQSQRRKLIRAALIRLDSLVLHAKLSSRLDKVVWGIFWNVFRRSCGPPTRSVGPTDRSASLLVGRTHLSGTAMSLIGGDLGVPMSHRAQENFVYHFTV
jgi:hypothetical protein